MMNWVRTICALAVLAACDAAVVAPQSDVLILRNPTAQIGSQVDVTARDMSGDWFVRQGIAGAWPATAGGLTLSDEAGTLGLLFRGGVCDRAGICFETEETITYFQRVPGRWQVNSEDLADQAGFPSAIWVYWMDFDRRTMAIGDPNGGYVAILDRAPSGGRDRIAAARDILDWYGYDLTQIVEVVR